MRKIVHRLLTGAPALVVSIGCLTASANPAKAKAHLDAFVALMSDVRFFWLCVSLVLAYFILWWITSLEPKSRADRLRQKGLLAMYDEMQSLANKLRAQKWSDIETDKIIEIVNTTDSKIQNWIRFNIGDAAVASYQSGTPQTGFSGSGTAYNFALGVDLRVSNLKSLCENPDDWHSIKRKWWSPWDHVEHYK